MHELSVMESAIALALEQLASHEAQRILAVTLRVGQMSGIDPDALRFAFDVVTQGTAAEGATLTLEVIQARCECASCGLDFEPLGHDYSCPRSPEHPTRIIEGTDLELTRLEVL